MFLLKFCSQPMAVSYQPKIVNWSSKDLSINSKEKDERKFCTFGDNKIDKEIISARKSHQAKPTITQTKKSESKKLKTPKKNVKTPFVWGDAVDSLRKRRKSNEVDKVALFLKMSSKDEILKTNLYKKCC